MVAVMEVGKAGRGRRLGQKGVESPRPRVMVGWWGGRLVCMGRGVKGGMAMLKARVWRKKDYVRRIDGGCE